MSMPDHLLNLLCDINYTLFHVWWSQKIEDSTLFLGKGRTHFFTHLTDAFRHAKHKLLCKDDSKQQRQLIAIERSNRAQGRLEVAEERSSRGSDAKQKSGCTNTP